MNVYANLLPFMNKIDEADAFIREWNGGIEISTDGPHWHGNTDWNREQERFESFHGDMGVHLPIWELNLASIQFPGHAAYSFDIYRTYLEWAAGFASHAVLHTHLYASPLFHKEEAQKRSRHYIKQLGEVAKQNDITLFVENVGFHDKMLFDEQEFVQLFEDIPTIKALLDVGHATINKWDIPAVIKALGRNLGALHLHDNDGKGDLHLPIGAGVTDWTSIWAALDTLSHSPKLILEYEGTAPLEVIKEHGNQLMREGKVAEPSAV
ncbi:sugar phosphate isomerase/epimerase [Shouchella miscanthi]|uniref:Sugar phosphate isomerase/epimerase n=1 Tax=Shouchella miscanthi TaxID=2598861 RepID=A0ABU6NKB2_9BACI|nr:sugar phosphate isomerase/epimerase [Shouchella miscanthi]